jgi:cell wall assembly regulator SMI1
MVSEIWARFKRELEARGVGPFHRLPPGASRESIDRLQAALGLSLPQDLVDLLLANDGDSGAPGVLFGAELLGVDVILREWTFQRSLDADPLALLNRGCASTPPGAILEQYTHPAWIPFLTDGDGTFFALDLAPGPRGKVGQVINAGRGQQRKSVLAASLGELLEGALADLTHGRFVFEEDPFDDDSGMRCIRRAPDLPYLEAAKRAVGLSDQRAAATATTTASGSPRRTSRSRPGSTRAS